MPSLNWYRTHYPFLLQDGRRYSTLSCAGHSIMHGPGELRRKYSVVVEEFEIPNLYHPEMKIWGRKEIPWQEAINAYVLDRARLAMELREEERLEYSKAIRPGARI